MYCGAYHFGEHLCPSACSRLSVTRAPSAGRPAGSQERCLRIAPSPCLRAAMPLPSRRYGMAAACVAGLQALCRPGLVGLAHLGVRSPRLPRFNASQVGGGSAWVSGRSKPRQENVCGQVGRSGNLGARSPRLCVSGSSGECSCRGARLHRSWRLTSTIASWLPTA